MDKRYIGDNLISKTGRVSSRMAKKYNVSVEEIYNIYYNTEGKCKECNNKPKFISFTKGYKDFCCSACVTKYYTREGIYKKAQVKARKTKLLKYNDEHYCNKDKVIQTKIEKYGSLSYNNYEKAKNTMKEKYGTEKYNNLEKHKLTCFNKYGQENIMQTGLIEVGYRWKDYILPSGNIIKIQGYENRLLDELLQEFREEEILTSRKDMPEFWYIDSKNIKRRYFPDVYIPSTETLYEVKSDYTLKCAKEGGIFELKEQSVRSEGYKFILKIYN